MTHCRRLHLEAFLQRYTNALAAPPDARRKVCEISSRCEVCHAPILPRHTWKFTPSGGKAHYYCTMPPQPAAAGVALEAA